VRGRGAAPAAAAGGGRAPGRAGAVEEGVAVGGVVPAGSGNLGRIGRDGCLIGGGWARGRVGACVLALTAERGRARARTLSNPEPRVAVAATVGFLACARSRAPSRRAPSPTPTSSQLLANMAACSANTTASSGFLRRASCGVHGRACRRLDACGSGTRPVPTPHRNAGAAARTTARTLEGVAMVFRGAVRAGRHARGAICTLLVLGFHGLFGQNNLSD
jgi:hypothetical protein